MRAAIIFLICASLCAVEVLASVTSVTDGDTIETTAGVVRLLYIDTPESRGNSHGLAMPEGKAASYFLSALLPAGAKVRLWSPGDKLEIDRYGRVLAVVIMEDDRTVQTRMVAAGWSPVWEKYGRVDLAWRTGLESAERSAKEAKAGAWATAEKYMVDKSNETTSAKSELAKPEQPAAAGHWLNTKSGVRHNAGCKHYGATSAGRACGSGEGRACGVCGG